MNIENTRKLFETENIHYQQFLGRNADGSYKIDWVNELWRGWCMAVSTLGLANETE